jgi:hypothetical protein
MTLPFLARQERPRVVGTTTHWRIIDGVYFRDCWVVLPGTIAPRLIPVRDDLLGAAA